MGQGVEENQYMEEHTISSLINLHCFVIIPIYAVWLCNMLFLQHFNWSHDQIGFII